MVANPASPARAQLPAADSQRLTAATLPGPSTSTDADAPPLMRPAAGKRLLSLDVFRGITIAAMLLVNNPGTGKFGYRWLQHAEWNGCEPPDVIFPFFLFIVGVSITYSLEKQRSVGASRRAIIIKIIRRSLIIFGIGLLLNLLPYFDWEITRIPGVLQRIALCYLVASLIVLQTGIRGQAVTAALLLVIYWVLIKAVPVPGYGAGVLEPDTNLAAYIDRALMQGHLWHHHWDPEGLLSTIPAVSTTLIGVLAGHWLRAPGSGTRRVIGLLAGGFGGIVLGLVLNIWLPINKALWTSSFVVFTGGAALIGLGLCYWAVDLKDYRRWATPFVVFGTNAILAYALSTAMTKALVLWTVTRADGLEVTLKTYIFEVCFLPLAAHRLASVLYALAFVLLWLALTSILYRRRIFIKI
jgi:predicted acyltransferase